MLPDLLRLVQFESKLVSDVFIGYTALLTYRLLLAVTSEPSGIEYV